MDAQARQHMAQMARALKACDERRAYEGQSVPVDFFFDPAWTELVEELHRDFKVKQIIRKHVRDYFASFIVRH